MVLPPTAGAADTFWSNPSFGNWTIASNWQQGLPNATTGAIIANNGTAFLNGASAEAFGLRIGIPIVTGGINTTTGTVILDANAALVVRSLIQVGRSTSAGLVGNGTLTISGGATLEQTASHTVIGEGNQGSTGTVTVSDAFSTLITTQSLTIGAGNSHGRLTLQNGGDLGSAGSTAIATTSGSTGSVTVTGVGSAWFSGGGIFVGGADGAASGGSGALRILNGGFVQAPLLKQWSTGVVEVNNGSSAFPGLLVTGTTTPPAGAGALGDLAVGGSGTGRMDITAGGAVFTNRGFLGFSAGANGTALLTGPNSRWTCNGSVWVGNGGEGTIEIADSALLSSAGNGYLGFENNSVGYAFVHSGARWNTANTLYIGGNAGGPGGSGTLIVQNSTLNAAAYVLHNTGGLIVANAQLLGPNNSFPVPLTINGGYIQAGGSTSFGGVSSVTTLGAEGVRFFTAGSFLNFQGRLTGPGGVNKGGGPLLGPGTLVLAGDSDYTGPTLVSGGTLEVWSSLASAVTINAGGTLTGDGSVGGITLNNGGILRPGVVTLSQKRIFVNGNYNQTSGGILEIQLRSRTNPDQVVVSGSAALDGVLNVSVADGFTPVVGDTFLTIPSNGATGNFSTINSPGLFLRSDVSPSGVVLTVVRVGAEIRNEGATIVSAGSNGVLDPGEVVTVSLGLAKNPGENGECTTALTASLAAMGGVTEPSSSQDYGAVCTGGPPAFRDFAFRVDPAAACGDVITATLALTDGKTDYGTLTYVFTLGSFVISLAQNFDDVAAPALPPDWTSTASGAETPWVTSASGFFSPPNSAFAPNPASVGNTELISPSFQVTANGMKVSFRNQYDTEQVFDGMVLEVSVEGGPFQDLLAAGGSFAAGGYNGTISLNTGSPIAGRQAWTGNSNGYITTVAILPPAALGQAMRLKWRMATDVSVGDVGVRIDDVGVSAAVCETNAPAVASAASRKVHGGSGPFEIDLPLTGTTGVECRTGGASGNHQVVVAFANPVSVESVSVTSIDGQASALSSVNGAEVTLDLTAVANAQTIQITLVNVSDGTNTGNVALPMSVLVGDTTGNGAVSASDIGQTKGQSGQPVTAANFRNDVTVNGGSVNASDIGLVKSASGTQLPTE